MENEEQTLQNVVEVHNVEANQVLLLGLIVWNIDSLLNEGATFVHGVFPVASKLPLTIAVRTTQPLRIKVYFPVFLATNTINESWRFSHATSVVLTSNELMSAKNGKDREDES